MLSPHLCHVGPIYQGTTSLNMALPQRHLSCNRKLFRRPLLRPNTTQVGSRQRLIAPRRCCSVIRRFKENGTSHTGNEDLSMAVEQDPKPLAPGKVKAVDGNEATATIAYAMSDASFIYPITPATPMGEHVDVWATEGRKNLFGNVMQVTEMESETGAAGALHGALAAGALATTFTCSQGLLLMLPNMYKIAGELMPCVLHVTARALAGQALSIFGDHQDVMAVRQAGWAMLCSHSVQEAADMALVAHLATLKASLPFVHFFDGFRTSHEINKVYVPDPESFRSLVDAVEPHIQLHRSRALNPNHPHQRGTSQGPDIYFQMLEAANTHYKAIPDIVQQTMNEVGAITGRKYRLFDYYGHPEADRVVVAMGSGCSVMQEAVDYLNQQGQRVGLVKVHLFRPWSAKHLLEALPKTVKRIAVLDRTKEAAGVAEPLFQDVTTSFARSEDDSYRNIKVIGGRYGLGSKDFTPAMGVAVFHNLAAPKPKDNFTVGINDDVTFTSLPVEANLVTVPPGTTQCIFWGMGSDGTVGANKEAIKIIGGASDKFVQAYFHYDAKKSGGVTMSHLRFGPSPITSSYLVEQADYVAVHHQSYLMKYDTLSRLRPGGILVINGTWSTLEELEAVLPDHIKRELGRKQPKLYLIDALAVAGNVGLGKRINMVMQTVFFYVSGVLPIDKATALLKDSIKKAYGKKGDKVVAQNWAAVDGAIEHLHQLEVPASWAHMNSNLVGAAELAAAQKKVSGPADFLEKVVKPMLAMEGDSLPVSVFTPGGFMPPGTTQIEQRKIAPTVPVWASDHCTQCNICSFVCPHAAVRPAMATQQELQGSPAAFETVPVRGSKALVDYQYRIQVSPMDCTGCMLCVHACPDNALTPTPIEQVLDQESTNWSFFRELPDHTDLFDKSTVRGSQFQPPLLEFSGACEGCGETPYVKLLTQLFGTRMIIANATGCSSIWGGSAPSNPYTTDKAGRGPAWGNSLFEDNAQYGFGIAMGTKQRRETLAHQVSHLLEKSVGSAELQEALREWMLVKDSGALCGPAATRVGNLLEEEVGAVPELKSLLAQKDMLEKPSVWIIGGDGWAYDIGFGGLDHVLSTGEDINILVLDTEMYSNTGGQKSKSTPLGAVVKFASGGKTRPKKDLCQMAINGYPDVYVASVCLEANYGQVVKAMAEAEAHRGVSLVVAYAPCLMHGICEGMGCAIEESRMAVDTGYWPLFRFTPPQHGAHDETGALAKGKFQLDSKRLKGDLEAFLSHENRFSVLTRKNPDAAGALHHELDEVNHARHDKLKKLAEDNK